MRTTYRLTDEAREELAKGFIEEFGEVTDGDTISAAYNRHTLDAIATCRAEFTIDDSIDFGEMDEAGIAEGKWEKEWIVLLTAEYQYGQSSRILEVLPSA